MNRRSGAQTFAFAKLYPAEILHGFIHLSTAQNARFYRPIQPFFASAFCLLTAARTYCSWAFSRTALAVKQIVFHSVVHTCGQPPLTLALTPLYTRWLYVAAHGGRFLP